MVDIRWLIPQSEIYMNKLVTYSSDYTILFPSLPRYERRASDRPAGIRTMGLVSLGSALFTINSQLAFKSSTMGWDSSRVTAAIPSGVGFLGAGLIWKGTVGIGDEEVHQVHGLTTAASLWLSAAVGVGCGGALYFATLYSVSENNISSEKYYLFFYCFYLNLIIVFTTLKLLIVKY